MNAKKCPFRKHITLYRTTAGKTTAYEEAFLDCLGSCCMAFDEEDCNCNRFIGGFVDDADHISM